MKKLLVSFAMAAILAMGVFASAQTAGPKGQAPKGQPKQGERRGGFGMGGGKRLMEQLNLTEAQKKKFEDLRMKMRDEMKKNIQAGQKPDPTKMKAAMEKYQKDIMAILTPAQQAKYKQLLEEMRKNREKGGFGPGGKPGAPPAGGKKGGAPKGGGGGG